MKKNTYFAYKQFIAMCNSFYSYKNDKNETNTILLEQPLQLYTKIRHWAWIVLHMTTPLKKTLIYYYLDTLNEQGHDNLNEAQPTHILFKWRTTAVKELYFHIL